MIAGRRAVHHHSTAYQIVQIAFGQVERRWRIARKCRVGNRWTVLMNLWLASPVIFLAGFLLLYTKSGFARIAGMSLIGSGLLIAAAPGDDDNWYLAVALTAIGVITFYFLRPRWWNSQPSGRWQFSLSALLVATAVLGICLAFNLWTWRHTYEQFKVAQAVDPILMNYTSTVGLRDGNVVWLSVNDIPPYETLGKTDESHQIDCSHWFRAPVNGTQKPFGDADLKNIARTCRSVVSGSSAIQCNGERIVPFAGSARAGATLARRNAVYFHGAAAPASADESRTAFDSTIRTLGRRSGRTANGASELRDGPVGNYAEGGRFGEISGKQTDTRREADGEKNTAWKAIPRTDCDRAFPQKWTSILCANSNRCCRD